MNNKWNEEYRKASGERDLPKVGGFSGQWYSFSWMYRIGLIILALMACGILVWILFLS